MNVWNLTVASHFGGDGVQVNQSLSFKTRDLAFDYAASILERRTDWMEVAAPHIASAYSEFYYEARNGRQYILVISQSPVLSSRNQF